MEISRMPGTDLNPSELPDAEKVFPLQILKTCLAEYAEVFKTVYLDAGFDQFISRSITVGSCDGSGASPN